MQSCIWIDDDLSQCGQEAQITYQVKLVTTLDVELNTVLEADTDVYLQNAFRKYYQNIFVDYVHDVDLSFYSKITQERTYHENHIIDASEKSFTLFLKADQYTHLSACNIDDAQNVSLLGDESPTTMQLLQASGDTLNPQTTGLFTARLDMDVQTDTSQNFIVPLFMANSGVGLVVDTLGSGVKHVEAYIQDVATDFFVMDSVYHFASNPLIRFDEVAVDMTLPASKGAMKRQEYVEKRLCYGTTCFPSRDKMVTDEYVWRVKVYVTSQSGKIAENTLTVRTPLRASSLRVLMLTIDSEGKTTVKAKDVGASVDLDWKPGGVYNPEL